MDAIFVQRPAQMHSLAPVGGHSKVMDNSVAIRAMLLWDGNGVQTTGVESSSTSVNKMQYVTARETMNNLKLIYLLSLSGFISYSELWQVSQHD